VIEIEPGESPLFINISTKDKWVNCKNLSMISRYYIGWILHVCRKINA